MQVRCPHCKAVLKLPPDLSSSRVRCSACRAVLAVSRRPAREAAPPAPEPSAPPPGEPRPEPPGPAGGAAPFAVPGEPEPGGSGVRVALGALSVLLMGALVLAYVYREDLADSVGARYRHCVPADARLVVFLHVGRVRSGAFGDLLPRLLAPGRHGVPAEFDALAVGPDDLSEVFVAMGEDGSAVCAVQTARSLALDAVVRAPGGAVMQTCEGMQWLTVPREGGELHVAKAGPAFFCLSASEAALQAALRRIGGRDRSIARHPLRRVLRAVRGHDWFLAGTHDGDPPAASPRVFEGLQASALGVTLDATARGELALQFPGPGQAAVAEKALQEKVGAARERLGDARVWRRDALVHVQADLAESVVRTLADMSWPQSEEAIRAFLQ